MSHLVSYKWFRGMRNITELDVDYKEVGILDLETVCNRDFTWRKKWIRVWNNVIYCSEKCRRNKSV